MKPRAQKLLSAAAIAVTGAAVTACSASRPQVTTVPTTTVAVATSSRAAPVERQILAVAPEAPPAPTAAVLAGTLRSAAQALGVSSVGTPMCGRDGRPLSGNVRKVPCKLPSGDTALMAVSAVEDRVP